jgi:hypothetical protein
MGQADRSLGEAYAKTVRVLTRQPANGYWRENVLLCYSEGWGRRLIVARVTCPPTGPCPRRALGSGHERVQRVSHGSCGWGLDLAIRIGARPILAPDSAFQARDATR